MTLTSQQWRSARDMAVTAIVVFTVGCAGRDDARSDSAAGAAATPAATPADTATRAAGGSASAGTGAMAMFDVGKLASGAEYLTDADGRAVYLFEKDKSDSSMCTGACAAAWPPVVSSTAPMAHNASIDAAKLGIITRPDGTKQATYDHKPLYYYAKDQARGDIKGQDLEDFGAEWYLVQPTGRKQEAKK